MPNPFFLLSRDCPLAKIPFGKTWVRSALAASAALLMCASPAVVAADNAPAQPSTSNPFGLPAAVKAAGRITVASSIAHPPFEYFERDNVTPTGFDIDLMKAIAARLGLEVKFEDVRFPNIPPGLKSARFDMAITALRDMEDRRKYADFVDYIKNSYQLLVAASNPFKITSTSDLCGRKLGGVSGQNHMSYVAEFSKQCVASGKEAIETLEFPSTPTVLLALKNGRIDAYYDTTATAGYTVKMDPAFKMAGSSAHEVIYGIAFPLGKAELVAAVQKALQSLMDDGSYAKIIDKYGLQPLAIDRATVNKGNG